MDQKRTERAPVDLIDAVIGAFVPRLSAATSIHDLQVVVLDVHEAVAKHHAERQWMSISSDARFISYEMPDSEVRTRFDGALDKLSEVVKRLHVRHGLTDPAFNWAAAETIVNAYFDRLQALAASNFAGRA